MSRLTIIVKAVLPAPLCSVLRAAHRGIVFRLAMRRFLKNPKACAHPEHRVLLDLIYGWGNESWSALDEYLACCIKRALEANGPMLECGSGLSTILIGAIAKQQGRRHWALEHTPHWATKVQKYLDRYKIDSVALSTVPLKDYGDYCWYDAPLKSMPERFSLVVCDGPPADTKGGRYGLVPIMKERLKLGTVVLLDDGGREHERAIAERWKAELGAVVEVHGSKKPFIELSVGTGQSQHPD